jgi:7-cyano-7-deazaguanine synthase in queuosine biosynthesis
MHERLVLCGHQVHKIRVRGERLYLKLTGNDLRHADPHSNISLRLRDISRKLLADLPDLLTDLLEIAAYVLAADAATDRGDASLPDMGDDWRRRFRFVIPVRRPEVWAAKELLTLLSETLSFLSEDGYRFEFVALQNPVEPDSYLDLRSAVEDAQRADEVVLFSGGIDSLAGAVDDLFGARKRVVLVSHHSSTKLAARQRTLASTLEQRARDRVLHVPVRMTKRGGLTVEYSQRSRSFFFVALGAVVARTVGTNRIRLYENGIVSVNLPIAENVIGARATRSTHPSVIARVNQLLGSLFEGEITVENPYALLTKAEVLERIAAHGCADLISQTVSCSSVYQIETERPHCGECTQCLGRRFAVLSAGLEQQDPEHGYRVRLFADERREGARRSLALSYIELARKLGRTAPKDFLADYGVELSRALGDMRGDREDNLSRLFQLHRRFGSQVMDVLAEAFQRYARELAEGTLPEHCLVRLAAGPDEKPRQVDQAGAEEPVAARDVDHPLARAVAVFDRENVVLALDHDNQHVVIEGLDPFSGDQVFRLFERLAGLRENDVAEKRREENYKFDDPATLAGDLNCDDQALRALIYRTRRRISGAAEEIGAPALSQNDIIENLRSAGYRLSRAVRVVALSEIRR